jgi:hypothetical protein
VLATRALEAQVAAFAEGRAHARPPVRVIGVSGGDAGRWLDDLVTAGVASLRDGEQTRSLLLTPTGRIRADVHVVSAGEGFVLVQDAEQPEPIGDLLARYVLSSDVELEDAGTTASIVAGVEDWRVRLGEATATDEVLVHAFETWRVRRGIPRFPVDLDPDSTPAEGGLERLIDFGKGCFLGQESVAKIRNLGHPARVVRALAGPVGVMRGDPVLVRGRRVGVVTSAVPADGASAVLARVAWASRDGALGSPAGRLLPR